MNGGGKKSECDYHCDWLDLHFGNSLSVLRSFYGKQGPAFKQ